MLSKKFVSYLIFLVS